MKSKYFLKIVSIFSVIFFSITATISITYALQVKGAENVNFKINASNPETFTKVYYQSSFFYGGEGKVYAYAWDSENDANRNADWPGVEMTQESYQRSLYSYEVSNKYDKIIFHANVDDYDPTKTENLNINRTNVYYCQHSNTWVSNTSECTFAYYLTGVLSGTSGWGNKTYENGLLKNYSGGNIDEYMKVDYIPKRGDEFKIIDNANNYYGHGGSTSGGNYNVLVNNNGDATAQVYFTLNSNLYSGVNFYFYNDNPDSFGYKLWCHQWPDGGSGTPWPGNLMTRDGTGGDYWFYSNVPLYYDCLKFNNKGDGGKGNLETADLKSIDISKPYYKSGNWSSSK